MVKPIQAFIDSQEYDRNIDLMTLEEFEAFKSEYSRLARRDQLVEWLLDILVKTGYLRKVADNG